MPEGELNIYQKLAKIRKQVEVMKKTASGYNYTYTPEEEILAKITVFMEKYGISLIPGIVPGTLKVEPCTFKKTKMTKQGNTYEETTNEILVSADTTFTWVNNDNPEERIVVPWAMTGQQSDSSQGLGSALTYSSRYFLLKYFNVSTTKDDPDAWRSKQKEAEVEAEKIIAMEIIKQVDDYIKAYLGKHIEKRDDIMALVTKYVKSGNYTQIKDPKKASLLLNDVMTNFVDEMEEE